MELFKGETEGVFGCYTAGGYGGLHLLVAPLAVMTVMFGGAGTRAEEWCSSLTASPELVVLRKEEGFGKGFVRRRDELDCESDVFEKIHEGFIMVTGGGNLKRDQELDGRFHGGCGGTVPD